MREITPAPWALILAGGDGSRLEGIDWSDWGHPRRVLASLGRAGLRPAWLDRIALAEAG